MAPKHESTVFSNIYIFLCEASVICSREIESYFGRDSFERGNL